MTVQFEQYQGVKEEKQVTSSTIWELEEIVLCADEMLNYFTFFRLFTHVGVNNIWTTVVFKKKKG